MLVPVEWLREYVSFDLAPEALADRLTMAGLEVEEIIDVGGQKAFSTYVTPNRPDLLSIVGVAREVSALLAVPLKPPKPDVPEGDVEASALVRIDIESPQNCPRYSGRVLRDVKVAESPGWMQERLIAGGLRPINNIVDATNYVLLELGQPMHAFDYDLVADHHIIVRQAMPGEKIVTIDSEERELNPDVLVIADAGRAVAVAGVMGGLDTEVSVRTRNVLLESAHFNRLSIRHTARSLQMSTEASYRFERGVDPALTTYALDRVAELIAATGGATIARGIVDAYPVKIEPITVAIRPERASIVLGVEVGAGEVEDYLTRLGMKVERDGSLAVTVPTFRPDIQREDDLIEEVGRLYGYDRIPAKLPGGETMQGRDSAEGRFAGRVSEILISAGLQEVVTGSMSPPMEGELQVAIRNPLSDDLSRLRKYLALDLLSVISYNSSRGIRDIGVFEIGRVFEPQDDDRMLVEKLSIAAAVTGSMWGRTWNVDRACLDADFFLCKGVVENLLDRLGMREVLFRPIETALFHPTKAAAIEAGGVQLGRMGEISAELARQYDIPERTCAFEIDLYQLMDRSGGAAAYVPLSRYPAVTRDLAVVVTDDVPYCRVEEVLAKGAGELLESLALFDLYKGPPLVPGQKSLAFTIVFRSHERTLCDDEIDDRLNEIRGLLTAELKASFRDT
ncbi:MAG TPA: phenylalanine--tRNA ligase subunit beta [Armatimonadota bacterium]|nr:phenylalanine--tRNA ligase subunit beta [Armatimonadota bacterium]